MKAQRAIYQKSDCPRTRPWADVALSLGTVVSIFVPVVRKTRAHLTKESRMQPLFVVDAFTDHPFAGNPAGVLVLDADRDPKWMQAVASELNLSETSFLRRHEDGVWSLRWFTPVLEDTLCGHATLAAAHVLWTEGYHPPDEPIRFATNSKVVLPFSASFQFPI